MISQMSCRAAWSKGRIISRYAGMFQGRIFLHPTKSDKAHCFLEWMDFMVENLEEAGEDPHRPVCPLEA